MPVIVNAGGVTDAALQVNDLYVEVQSPSNAALQGVTVSRVGVVGTASWGPVSTPVVAGTIAEASSYFGVVNDTTTDLMTDVTILATIGTSDMRLVRVTDGTDMAATATPTIGTGTPITITSRYTGTAGNSISVSLQVSAINTKLFTLIVSRPGSRTEQFPLTLKGSASTDWTAFWTAMVAAINNGVTGISSPSKIVVATLSATPSVAPVAAAAIKLSGGTDGSSGVTTMQLLGAAGTVNTGLYALTGTGCAICFIAGDDSSVWANVMSFCKTEGVYGMLAGPSGGGYTALPAAMAAQGITDWSVKVLAGDWLYWYDAVLGYTRLRSPKAWAAGILSQLGAENSGLNKQIIGGIIGSEQYGLATDGVATPYSNADIAAMTENAIDVITNPAPGGRYWALRVGYNASAATNTNTRGDNYTRMTHFLSKTIANSAGIFVGQPITSTLMDNVTTTLTATLANLVSGGTLSVDPVTGALPYSVMSDGTNNTDATMAAGFLYCDVRVRYLNINEKFIVRLDGGGSVVVTPASTAS